MNIQKNRLTEQKIKTIVKLQRFSEQNTKNSFENLRRQRR